MEDTADHLPSGILILDQDGRIQWMNPFAGELLGYAPGALLGEPVDRLLTIASRIYFQTHIYPLIRLGKIANELYLTLRSQQGASIPVLMNSGLAESGGKVRISLSFIPVYQRRQYEQELLAAKKAAEDALLRNEELTRLKEELERHQVKLDEQMSHLRQRTEELEQFSKIISHDLQEPLRKIALFSDMLGGEAPSTLSPKGNLALGGLARSSARLRQIMHDLQLFFTLTHSVSKYEPVNPTPLIRLLASEYKPAELELELHPLPEIEGDLTKLTTLFRHLLSNAVKFRQPGQPATVRVEGTVVGHNSFRTIPNKYHYVHYARLTFTDNGQGFEKEYREEVFRMLHKLHPHTPGLGLGLALAKRIVEGHNGQIMADSTPGQGTRVTVWLPITASS